MYSVFMCVEEHCNQTLEKKTHKNKEHPDIKKKKFHFSEVKYYTCFGIQQKSKAHRKITTTVKGHNH